MRDGVSPDFASLHPGYETLPYLTQGIFLFSSRYLRTSFRAGCNAFAAR
jgi:hypothetical protein